MYYTVSKWVVRTAVRRVGKEQQPNLYNPRSRDLEEPASEQKSSMRMKQLSNCPERSRGGLSWGAALRHRRGPYPRELMFSRGDTLGYILEEPKLIRKIREWRV